jgi:predicted neutral ceramidase superfamily lipid hydrolase
MKFTKRVIVLWIISQLIYGLALLIFPHRILFISSLANRGIQTALLLLSVYIYRNEPNKKNKYIFLNFVFAFSVVITYYLYDFIGLAIFQDSKYAAHLLNQYSTIGFQVLLALSITYMVVDLLFRDLKVYQKYFVAAFITLFLSTIYFHPYFKDPLYLYSTEDIKQWKTLDNEIGNSTQIQTTAQLASRIKLQSWQDGHPIGDLYPEENLKKIDYLIPYLEYNNWIILLFKPLYCNVIYMNIFNIFFILLFFGYQYKKDPPQGAYIDKIMFMLLLLSSMDILHNWGFIKSVEVTAWSELFNVSQYVTVLIEMIMVLFFVLRLRFITSPQGEFYETELATDPQHVSRWRDGVDNLILSHFFNFKLFNGRLFQNPDSKS